jgi:hypothetical protein
MRYNRYPRILTTMNAFGRILRDLFLDTPIRVALIAAVILLVFVAVCLSFFRPYTSDPWPRVASWLKATKDYLARIQRKLPRN